MKTIEEIVSSAGKKINRNLGLIADLMSQKSADKVCEESDQRLDGCVKNCHIVRGKVTSSDPDLGVELLLQDGRVGWIPPRNLEGRDPNSRLQLTSWFYPGRILTLQVEGVDEETGRVVLRRVSRALLERRKSLAHRRYRKVTPVRMSQDSFKYIAVDAANIMGIVASDDLRSVIFKAIDEKVRALGKVPVFFVETSLLNWLRRCHLSAYRVVQEFVNDTTKCVLCKSRSECDRELLAFLETRKDAIALSCDGYKDYGVDADVRSRIYGATFIAAIPGLPPTLQLSWLGESIELA